MTRRRPPQRRPISRLILQHPRLINEPDSLIDYAGQPAIRFQLRDVTSTGRLMVLAHPQMLRILAISKIG